jgi:hypothetical protein
MGVAWEGVTLQVEFADEDKEMKKMKNGSGLNVPGRMNGQTG